MSSVSRPEKGETGKNIFLEGGHDEHQHDNADDANNTCVYRESKSERIDDEVRPRWRANL